MSLQYLLKMYRTIGNGSCRNARAVMYHLIVRMDSTSSVLQEARDYELGNFEDDLKPYLKKQKKKGHYLMEIVAEKRKTEVPIISGKDIKMNHYENQPYSKMKPIPLISKSWTSYKSKGDYFTINIIANKHNVITDDRPSFDTSDLDPKIIEVLKQKGIEKMSIIQEKAVPIIRKGTNTLIAAETGCGKTLAYLAPIVDQILAWKSSNDVEFNSPLALIISPSRELTEQIHEIAKWFDSISITSMKLLGGSVRKKMLNPNVKKTDILVSTIGIIRKMTTVGILNIKDVRHVVLDEADSLMDDSFNETVVEFLEKFKFRNAPSKQYDVGVQLTLASATMPTSIPEILGDVVDIDSIEKVTTDKLHYVLPNVEQRFIRVGRSTKPASLLRIVKDELLKKKQIIIFCNKSPTCNWASYFLTSCDVPHTSINSDISLRSRKGRFQEFQNGDVPVLVCTDVASRGLDTKQVSHVINYDFPNYIADYIHRCGRIGRLGGKLKGKVTNLISGKNEIELVSKIELAVRTGSLKFDNVNANIKRIMNFKRASPIERSLGLEPEES